MHANHPSWLPVRGQNDIILSSFKHGLLFIARKVVIDAINRYVSDHWRCFFFLWGLKLVSNIINMSSIMLAREHNFRHNGAVLRVTLKSIITKFSSITYVTLLS